MTERRWSRCLQLAGWLLIASGLAHIGVWASLGGPWHGPTAWRKPILFGLSSGVTALSLAWVMARVRPRRGDRWLSGGFAAIILAEVGLITLQTWRGTASHYNEATPLDAAIASAMNALIVAATLVIAHLTARSFGPLSLEPPMALALRAGMAYLLIGCVIGFAVHEVGLRNTRAGLDPEYFGKNGVLKFPHGMPLHAVQWLPLVAWGVNRSGWPERIQWRAVAAAVTGQAIWLVFSLWQTFTGRGRGELTAATAVFLAVGGTLIAGAAVLALVPARRSGRG